MILPVFLLSFWLFHHNVYVSAHAFGIYGFYPENSIATASDGSFALIADAINGVILKNSIDPPEEAVAFAGTILTSGSEDGIGLNATFNLPICVTLSPDDSYALVADFGNNLIRKIIMSTAEVMTLAADFYKPYGISISADGSYAMINDHSKFRRRRLILFSPTGEPTSIPSSLPTGQPTSIPTSQPSGIPSSIPSSLPTGQPTSIPTSQPSGIPSSIPSSLPTGEPTFNPSTSPTFNPSTSPTFNPSTSPTFNPSTSPTFNPSTSPTSLVVPSFDYLSVTLTAGGGGGSLANGMGTNAKFNNPEDISISSDGSFALIAERSNNLVRKMIISTSFVTTIAGGGPSGFGDGIGTNSGFRYPGGISISSDMSFALVADTSNHIVRKIILSTLSVTTFAGSGVGSANGIGTNSNFNNVPKVIISPDDSFALVADYNNNLIRKIIISTASVTTFAGSAGSGSNNGIGTNSKFYGPVGITISPDGSFALITETNNHLVRKIIISTASVTTFAGVALTSGSNNGIGTNSKFYGPIGVTISPDGSFALITETSNHLVRKIIISTASVTTIAGQIAGYVNGIGTNSKFNGPRGISISPDSSFALLADEYNNAIRTMTAIAPPTYAPTLVPTKNPTTSRRF